MKQIEKIRPLLFQFDRKVIDIPRAQELLHMFQVRADAQLFAGPSIGQDPEFFHEAGVTDDRIHRFGVQRQIWSEAPN